MCVLLPLAAFPHFRWPFSPLPCHAGAVGKPLPPDLLVKSSCTFIYNFDRDVGCVRCMHVCSAAISSFPPLSLAFQPSLMSCCCCGKVFAPRSAGQKQLHFHLQFWQRHGLCEVHACVFCCHKQLSPTFAGLSALSHVMMLLWESLCPQICWSKAAALSFTVLAETNKSWAAKGGARGFKLHLHIIITCAGLSALLHVMLLLCESICPQICWHKAATLSFTGLAAFLHVAHSLLHLWFSPKPC